MQMGDTQASLPDATAVRVALWRAIHALDDSAPHVIEDKIGLRLIAPDPDWRERPDMDPDATKPFRASILARARFIEDHVEEQANRGIRQYLIFGAGLDTFAQRRPELASRMNVFEMDRPELQAWKRQRLVELGYGIPEWLRLVPLNFETSANWLLRLEAAGFGLKEPAVVASTGVSMYLTKDANAATMSWCAQLAPGSTFLMTFLQPIENIDPELRSEVKTAEEGARNSGTPFISFYRPDEIMSLARKAGFSHVTHIPAAMLAHLYFEGRDDGLRPPDKGEEIIIART
jgi:methyltransferase (TIGR00027 family)